MILTRLLCDPAVALVRLYWGSGLHDDADCRPAPSCFLKFGVATFGAHPQQPGLEEIRGWSDRPHFARRATYERRVWPLFADGRRALPERALSGTEPKDSSWGLWLYAPACSLRHERHAGGCGYRPSRNPAYG